MSKNYVSYKDVVTKISGDDAVSSDGITPPVLGEGSEIYFYQMFMTKSNIKNGTGVDTSFLTGYNDNDYVIDDDIVKKVELTKHYTLTINFGSNINSVTVNYDFEEDGLEINPQSYLIVPYATDIPLPNYKSTTTISTSGGTVQIKAGDKVLCTPNCKSGYTSVGQTIDNMNSNKTLSFTATQQSTTTYEIILENCDLNASYCCVTTGTPYSNLAPASAQGVSTVTFRTAWDGSATPKAITRSGSYDIYKLVNNSNTKIKTGIGYGTYVAS